MWWYLYLFLVLMLNSPCGDNNQGYPEDTQPRLPMVAALAPRAMLLAAVLVLVPH
jgi:hypothetical protein